jgi:S1-C subfamily serine protease
VAEGGESAGSAGVAGGSEIAGAHARGREVTVLQRDDALDLAVLRVPGATGPPVRFGDADGELRVLTAPRRGGAARVAATGPVVQAGLRRRINARLVDQPGKPRRPSFELAADIVSGDSGAPVVDSDGEIVGVVYARSTRRGGTAYAVRVLVAPR